MKKQIILSLLILTTMIAFGQIETDCVILKPDNGLIKPDTIWGDIILPENGIIMKVKITTSNGLEKFKIKEIIGFQADERHFVSVPYNSGHVIAERLIKGNIDLYFYDTRIKNHYYGGGLIGGAMYDAMHGTMISMTSFYYLKNDKTNGFLKVPHSKNKIIDKVSYIFKTNDEIYKKIKNANFKPCQIPEFVEKFNANNIE